MKKNILVLSLLLSNYAFAQSPGYQNTTCSDGTCLADSNSQTSLAPGISPIMQASSQLSISAREFKRVAHLHIRGEGHLANNKLNMNVNINGGELEPLADKIERDANSLETQVLGGNLNVVRQTLSAIDADSKTAMNLSVIMNAIEPELAPRAHQLVKAVGAAQFALQLPNLPPVAIDPAPPVPTGFGNIKASKCSLRFANAWGDVFATSGEGFNESGAISDLYNNCSKIGGSYGNVSNAQACQSKIAAAKCVNIVALARAKDAGLDRFAACTMSFANDWGDTFTQNGAGENAVVALNQLWNACASVGGSYGNIANAQMCRQALTAEKAACTVR